MPTQPRQDQLQALLANVGEGRFHMLNLLAFKERAAYADGRETDLSGAEAYALYGAEVMKIVRELGGRPVYAGRPHTLVIGDGSLEWDAVAIVEYPSKEAFLKMVSSQAYQAIHVHREAGLAHQLLVACQPLPA